MDGLAADARPAAPTPGHLVTRFEVIDHREHTVRGPDLSYQDGGRTLKVFVTDRAPLAAPAASSPPGGPPR
jgi:hypothetical protein